MKSGDADPQTLRWQISELKSLSIRLLDVKCADQAKMEQVRKSFDPDSTQQWKEIPPRNIRVLQFGGIAQMISLSSIPIPMVGPANDQRIKVLGYIVMNPHDGSGPVKQTESYELRRQPDPAAWHGSYTLVQDGENPQNRVEIVFDMKMTLQPVNE